LANTELALDVAYEKFGIPKIVDAEDLCSEQRDDKILITYLSLMKDMVCTVLTLRVFFFGFAI
jgi:hypothetical protein